MMILYTHSLQKGFYLVPPNSDRDMAYLADRILQLKGDMGYREFARAIRAKTGKAISFSLLRQAAAKEKMLGNRAISILAEYAGKPRTWFYDPVAAVADSGDAREYLDRVADSARYGIYRTDLPPGLSADSPQEDWAAFLTDAISRSGIDLDDTGRRQIAEAAAAVVATLARQRAAKPDKPDKPDEQDKLPRRREQQDKSPTGEN